MQDCKSTKNAAKKKKFKKYKSPDEKTDSKWVVFVIICHSDSKLTFWSEMMKESFEINRQAWFCTFLGLLGLGTSWRPMKTFESNTQEVELKKTGTLTLFTVLDQKWLWCFFIEYYEFLTSLMQLPLTENLSLYQSRFTAPLCLNHLSGSAIISQLPTTTNVPLRCHCAIWGERWEQSGVV